MLSYIFFFIFNSITGITIPLRTNQLNGSLAIKLFCLKHQNRLGVKTTRDKFLQAASSIRPFLLYDRRFVDRRGTSCECRLRTALSVSSWHNNNNNNKTGLDTKPTGTPTPYFQFPETFKLRKILSNCFPIPGLTFLTNLEEKYVCLYRIQTRTSLLDLHDNLAPELSTMK